MGFFTEMFSRPRPFETSRITMTAAVVGASIGTRRIEDGSRPADFPRLARTTRSA